jgi:hypothetical protein
MGETSLSNCYLESAVTYPLIEYAAWHWVEHARFKNVSEFTEDGMKELFDLRRRHLEIWVWICDPQSLLAGLE